jgi:D-xylose transport system substrate-binding protein
LRDYEYEEESMTSPKEESTMSSRRWARLLVALVALVAALGIAACGGDDDDDDGGGGGGGESFKIALLLPETGTARYEAADRPIFEARINEECPNCEILYSNADQDATQQVSQLEAAVTEGADVIVLDPVDATAAAGMVTRANQSDIPVVSYDRLILDADLNSYVSFDNERVGVLQGEALSDKLKEMGSPNGPIIKINGDPADSNAALFKKGSNGVFEQRGVEIAKEYDTPGWLAGNARQEADQAITALGNDGFAAIYSANDTLGGAIIAALKGAGIDPATRPVTGQDAELAGIQRILAGEQFMTVYKSYKQEATAAADLALAAARGEDPPGVNQELDNGFEKVPSVILTPVVVETPADIKQTVLKDQLYTVGQICSGQYAADCKKAGLE